MSMKPKLEIKHYHGDGKKDYAVFRADRIGPICAGITHDHAEFLIKLINRKLEIPEKITPIDDWYLYDYILADDEIN